jgi:hypothetical protein
LKKTIFLLAAVGMAFFASCDRESTEPTETKEENPTNGEEDTPKPFPVGTWYTTHEYFKITASIPGERNKETDIYIDTKAESYQLTFKADGSGSGSGVRPDGNGRYDFDFNWELVDDRISMRYSGSTVVFWVEDQRVEQIGWELEESSAYKMVLSTEAVSLITPVKGGWIREDYLYRYTFEKMKEE